MMINSSTTVYAGVPVGETSLLTSGKYQPVLAVANFGLKDAEVAVTFARTTNPGKPESKVVQSLIVPAGRSKVVNLDDMAGDPQMRNSFLITSAGPPGQILTKLSSLGNGDLREVELLGKDERDAMNGGAHPWSIEDGTDSTLLLFNHSQAPEVFEVLIGHGRFMWHKTYTLQSMETTGISFRDLIQAQEKDENGHALPRNLQNGEVKWAAAPERGKGRILESNVATAMARGFSCGFGTHVCSVDLNPISGTFNIGDSVSFTAGNIQGCTSGTDPDPCFNDVLNGPYGVTDYSWEAGTPAGVPDPSGPFGTDINNNGSDATATASRAGNAVVVVTVTDINGCQASNNGSYVVKPTISGSAHDLWFFNGAQASSGATVFPVSITLTTNGTGTITWNVTQGSNQVNLSAQGATATLTSSGSNFSHQNLDVSVTVTVNGITSDPFTLTTHRPYKLVLTGIDPSCNSDFGYSDLLHLKLFDQLNTDMSIYVFDFNETFTTSPVSDNGSNWALFGTPTPTPATNSEVADLIQGVGVNNTPPPSPTPVCSGNDTQVYHIGQEWRIGGLTQGTGVRVSIEQFTKYADKANYLNLVSPSDPSF